MLERHFANFHSPEDVLNIGLIFITLERKLGEIDRVRALFNYMANYTDPGNSFIEKFWSNWHEFEVVYGSEESYREMMKVKRTTEIKFSSYYTTDLET